MRGSVLVNGRERSMATYRHQCTLITQEFVLLGELTVKETLRIATELKLHSKYSKQDRVDVVGTQDSLNTSHHHDAII